MGDDAAQGADRRFKLLERAGIFLGENEIDLLRKRSHRVVEADQILCRRQAAQGVADLGDALFQAGEQSQVDAGFTRMIEALRQSLDFDFK